MDEFESFDSSKKVGVVGCGLIGGSIALSLSNSGYQVFVVDLPGNEGKISKQIPFAVVRKSIRDLCADVPSVIFICAPTDQSSAILEEIASSCRKGTIITDVSGVKLPIMEKAARSVPDGVIFVGGHPMAGSEKSGVEAAQPFLFQNAVYVFSPLKKYSEKEIAPLVEAVERLGARILFMDASQHDRIAAATSHLPQLIAVELVNLIGDLSSKDEHFNTLAAGGFRDMTRVASSDFSVWQEVISANRQNISEILDAFIGKLEQLKSAVEGERTGKIKKEFESANHARRKIGKSGKGFLKPLYDLHVVVEDKVGVLKEITSTLADSGINIKDMELLKVREGTGGMFRLSFDTEEIMDEAARILGEHGFQVLRKEFEG